jgi:hypothetical protein
MLEILASRLGWKLILLKSGVKMRFAVCGEYHLLALLPSEHFWVLTSRRGCIPSPGMGFMLSQMYSKDYGEEMRAGNKLFTLLGAGTSNSLLPSSYITPAAPGISHRKGGYWMYTCDVAPEPPKTAPPCALVEACVLPISCNLKLDPETENFGSDYPLFLTCTCHRFSLSI